MIKTCPICNRDFESVIANATYCNPSCRKKAGREKEKEKQSAFYVPPKMGNDLVLWTLTRPSLDELYSWATILELFVRESNSDRCVMIYGVMPEGWSDREYVSIGEQTGMTPKSWAMITMGLTKGKTHGKLVIKPETKSQREAVIAGMSEEEREIERRVMEED